MDVRRLRRPRLAAAPLAAVLLLAALPAGARAANGGAAFGSNPRATTTDAGAPVGGASPSATAPAPAAAAVPAAPAAPAVPAVSAPTAVGTLAPDGTAVPPAGAPAAVVAFFAAANKIATLPYRYGGGHGSFDDTAYDCSGSVSYALHGAGLLDATMASTGFMTWGRSGPGQWLTIYANKDHMFVVVAGLRFDTSGQKATATDTRWQPMDRSTKGFVVRHPDGY